MSVLERVAQIKAESDQCKACPDGHLHSQIDYLLKAFSIMHGIASEMADMASGCNGDYGEIERMLEEGMK